MPRSDAPLERIRTFARLLGRNNSFAIAQRLTGAPTEEKTAAIANLKFEISDWGNGDGK
jgi:hypothetical protein